MLHMPWLIHSIQLHMLEYTRIGNYAAKLTIAMNTIKIYSVTDM